MKPSSDELHQALEKANEMRESDEDSYHLAKSLIYLKHRVDMLEKVCTAANQYLRFGQDEHEHAQLLQALEAARLSEDHDSHHENQELGL